MGNIIRNSKEIKTTTSNNSVKKSQTKDLFNRIHSNADYLFCDVPMTNFTGGEIQKVLNMFDHDITSMSHFLDQNFTYTTNVLALQPFTIPSTVTDGSYMFYQMILPDDAELPVYDFSHMTNVRYMFSHFKGKIPYILDFSAATDVRSIFANSSASLSGLTFSRKVTDLRFLFTSYQLASIPVFSLPNTNGVDCGSMFAFSRITEIPAIDFSNATNLNNTFYSPYITKIHCTHLKESFRLYSYAEFTREALVEIIGNLDPVTTTQTFTMGSTLLAKLTAADKKVATDKGWTLA